MKAHLSLLDKIGCNIVLESEKAPSILADILTERPMKRIPIASWDSFLANSSGKDIEDYPFQGTFAEVKNKPWVILHTSGSTGIPKPVFVPHGVFASQDAQQLIPFLGGKPTWVDRTRGKRIFIGLPLFHAACLAKVAYSIYAGGIVVLPPVGPMSADVVDSVFTHGNVDGALIAPSLIMDLYKNPEYFSNMVQRLEFVSYIGGTISKTIGDDIASKMELVTMFGATETLSHAVEIHDNGDDWDYISYSPFTGHIYRPVGNGLSEMIIVRNPDLELFQGVFSTFPNLTEYGTSDLYEPHPTREGMWRFKMRGDDIICFNNAEKLNPITMEATISGHPKVHSAVIGGHGQFQACLLLEPKAYPNTPEETRQFLDAVWPTVVEANKDCPAHGRIMKDFIMLTDPSRPLPRAGKDTVQRSAVFELYQNEFKAIYDQLNKSNGSSPSTPEKLTNGTHQEKPVDAQLNGSPDVANFIENSHKLDSELQLDDIKSYVEQYVHSLVPKIIAEQLNQALGNIMGQMAAELLHQPKALLNGHNGRSQSIIKDEINKILLENTYLSQLTDDANLFDCGLDSVQTLGVVKHINNALDRLGLKAGPISTKTIYDNPSVNKLVHILGEV